MPGPEKLPRRSRRYPPGRLGAILGINLFRFLGPSLPPYALLSVPYRESQHFLVGRLSQISSSAVMVKDMDLLHRWMCPDNSFGVPKRAKRGFRTSGLIDRGRASLNSVSSTSRPPVGLGVIFILDQASSTGLNQGIDAAGSQAPSRWGREANDLWRCKRSWSREARERQTVLLVGDG
jgi:hypothetical protein